MSEQAREPGTGHFIPAELRPAVSDDLDATPLLEPGVSKAEIERQLAAVMGDPDREGLQESGFSPEMWKTVFTRVADVTSTVLDDEAVLLNLANGVYYSLNPVGTAIWEQLTGSHTLAEILGTVCRQFEVTEEAARQDLVALVSKLRDERYA
jgi:coenzyme PQQ synthesis protein D (PqqD)